MTVGELIAFLQCHKPHLRIMVEAENDDAQVIAELRAASTDEDERGPFVYLMAYDGPSERVITLGEPGKA